MYKLVIADDEPKIRRGLKNILDWSAYNIEFAGEAEDGERAYQMIGQTEPDILFLDICMPFLNGIELLQKIKKENTHCRIIVITGYDEFSYAQQALKWGAFDYLLKPVMISDLEKSVRRAVADLDAAQDLYQYKKMIMDNSQEIADILLDQYFFSLISGNTKNETAYKPFISGLNRGEAVNLFVIKTSKSFMLNKFEKNTLCYGIQNILGELILKETFHSCFFDDKNANLVIIYGTVISKETDPQKSIMDYVESFTALNLLCETATGLQLNTLPAGYDGICRHLAEKSKLHPITQMIVNYIEKHAAEKDLSLRLAAEELKMSSSYLSKILKDDTGLSFVDFLTDFRIKKAKDLLKNPTIRIYEASEMVGYSNQYYFSRAFKKFTGLSPIEFKEGRRNCKKNA